MSKSEKSKQPEKQWSLWFIVPSVVFLWLVMGAAPYLLNRYFGLFGGFESLGSFGDMFGVANSLFSALAFALLIYASWMQREELMETRKEVSGQREALEAQVKHLERQGFERTFFEMLSVHQRNLGSLQCFQSLGVDAAARIFDEVQNGMKSASWEKSKGSEFYIAQYEKCYDGYERYLGQYYRGLYTLLKFIDGSAVVDKQTYARIVRAQLSTPELGLLFHNGLSSHATKMKPLINKYGLLKHCSLELICGLKALRPLYADSAFGSN